MKWKSGSDEIDIRDMDNRHLVNAFKFCQRRGIRALTERDNDTLVQMEEWSYTFTTELRKRSINMAMNAEMTERYKLIRDAESIQIADFPDIGHY